MQQICRISALAVIRLHKTTWMDKSHRLRLFRLSQGNFIFSLIEIETFLFIVIPPAVLLTMANTNKLAKHNRTET